MDTQIYCKRTYDQNIKVAVRLEIARKRSGLSIRQAAKKLDLIIEDIKKIESGDAILEDRDLRKFSDLYKVNWSWLNGQAPDSETQVALNQAREKLNKMNISSDEINNLLDYAYMCAYISSKNSEVI